MHLINTAGEPHVGTPQAADPRIISENGEGFLYRWPTVLDFVEIDADLGSVRANVIRS